MKVHPMVRFSPFPFLREKNVSRCRRKSVRVFSLSDAPPSPFLRGFAQRTLRFV